MKKFCAWLSIVALLTVSLCVPVLATAESVEPRIGIAGYASAYTNGSPHISFTVDADPFLTVNQMSVKTTGFASDTSLTITLTASDGVNMLHDGYLLVTGDKYIQNYPLLLPLTKQTYTVEVYIIGEQYSNAQVEVWLF